MDSWMDAWSARHQCLLERFLVVSVTCALPNPPSPPIPYPRRIPASLRRTPAFSGIGARDRADSFPYDDHSSTFVCRNEDQENTHSGYNSMSYVLTFCPGDTYANLVA